jgi:hypothetical protein
MNTQNTFLKFTETDHLDGKPRETLFCTVGDVLNTGVPIDDFGDDMEDDGFLYRKIEGIYQKIA